MVVSLVVVALYLGRMNQSSGPFDFLDSNRPVAKKFEKEGSQGTP